MVSQLRARGGQQPRQLAGYGVHTLLDYHERGRGEDGRVSISVLVMPT
jgi:hypothetical protein